MDRQTEQAIDALWKRGIDAINKRIDNLSSTIDERFDKYESERRWRITQTIFVFITLVTFLVDIIVRHR